MWSSGLGCWTYAKRLVLQCIHVVSSNPVEGRTKNISAQRSNSKTVWFNFQTYMYMLDTTKSK